MGAAKSIVLKPISRAEADECVKRHHYSGKVCQNSQVHIGVFLHGSLEGAMQLGPSMDKRKTRELVRDTPWDGFLELNRMAFGPRLPRNSESRALAIAMRLLRKHRPSLQWVLSFADGTQCGDGTIYRAAGFVLTGIKRNTTMLVMPDQRVVAKKTLDNFVAQPPRVVADKTLNNFVAGGRRGAAVAREMGARPLPGFQLRYLFPLHADVLARLTTKVLPFSAIDEVGARMYKGQRGRGQDSVSPAYPAGEGGAIPTLPLHEGDREDGPAGSEVDPGAETVQERPEGTDG